VSVPLPGFLSLGAVVEACLVSDHLVLQCAAYYCKVPEIPTFLSASWQSYWAHLRPHDLFLREIDFVVESSR
jgi:hypothetical protein